MTGVKPDWQVDEYADGVPGGHECNEYCRDCGACQATIHADNDGMFYEDEVAEAYWPAQPERGSALVHASCMTEGMALA